MTVVSGLGKKNGFKTTSSDKVLQISLKQRS